MRGHGGGAYGASRNDFLLGSSRWNRAAAESRRAGPRVGTSPAPAGEGRGRGRDWADTEQARHSRASGVYLGQRGLRLCVPPSPVKADSGLV